MKKISKPFKKCTPQSLTQGFSESHRANDFGGKYGEFLVAVCNSIVVGITTANNIETSGEELRRGFGIRLQSIEYPTLSYTYWHCQPFFPLNIGDIVLQGQPVAMMGNSGFVLSNGNPVEISIRTIPPYPGTHVHWSMGQQIGQDYIPLDPLSLIDWDIPINSDVITTVKIILIKILSFIKVKSN